PDDASPASPLPPMKAAKLSAAQNTRRRAPASNKSSLIPVAERRNAVVGLRDESLLRILCKDFKTNKDVELTFKRIFRGGIDWDNIEHIRKINAWRNQIYGRGGKKAKEVIRWNEDEEYFIELYQHLLVVAALKGETALPKPNLICEDFNVFFRGKILTNKDGTNTTPRVDRGTYGFTSKLGRIDPQVKERIRAVVWDRNEELYRPVITEDMLAQYKNLKRKLKAKGVMQETTQSSKDLEHWQEF
ncbi:hypothetical protein BDV95DRAFT_476632, partial [Massariosphaeria phaeospora]